MSDLTGIGLRSFHHQINLTTLELNFRNVSPTEITEFLALQNKYNLSFEDGSSKSQDILVRDGNGRIVASALTFMNEKWPAELLANIRATMNKDSFNYVGSRNYMADLNASDRRILMELQNKYGLVFKKA